MTLQIGDSWCVLFSHPKDTTPICTMELGPIAEHRVPTSTNWRQGEGVITAGSVLHEEARTIYSQDWRAPGPYPGRTK